MTDNHDPDDYKSVTLDPEVFEPIADALESLGHFFSEFGLSLSEMLNTQEYQDIKELFGNLTTRSRPSKNPFPIQDETRRQFTRETRNHYQKKVGYNHNPSYLRSRHDNRNTKT